MVLCINRVNRWELYLFLVNLIVYGNLRHDNLIMVYMNHIESS